MPILTLLTTKGTVHQAGGLNWGYSEIAHVRRYDAYIPIHIGTIRRNRDFFRSRDLTNAVLTFIWDDGTEMSGMFEGTQIDLEDNLRYPKQISTYPHKDILGRYIRRRLNVPEDRRITFEDLANYGRTDISIEQISDARYSLDFHV